MKWFFISGAVVMIGFVAGMVFENHEKEQTKRIELQLKIEMVKAGVTNLPSIVVNK